MMTDFTLIDLGSQSEEVKKYVTGWGIETILNWMKRFGTIEQVKDAHGTTIYVFQSLTGKKDAFFFDEENSMTVIKTGWRMY